MKVFKSTAVFVMMFFAFGMYSQFAAAFERAVEECQFCHEQIIDNKASLSSTETAVDIDKMSRQTVVSYSQLKQHGANHGESIITLSNKEDYWSRIPTEPAWRK